MRIRLSSRAYRDIENIGNYFAEQSPAAGAAIFQAIDNAFSRLSEMPLLGRVTDEPTVRRLVLARYPYAIFYQIEGDTISIITVFHTAQDAVEF